MAEDLLQVTQTLVVNPRYLICMKRCFDKGYRNGVEIDEDTVSFHLFAGNGASQPFHVSVHTADLSPSFHNWLTANNLTL